MNHRHQLTGHVLSGRYKGPVVEGGGNGYLKAVRDHVRVRRRPLVQPGRGARPEAPACCEGVATVWLAW